ncbi:PREDICTED: anaphase-promoting complex subunit 2-like [Thamnophis sirtalis]|uniref:Anaphase-promoting complex subunit 2-like n=1 Tax=Thamnophis sirtalis TaxID=35019 RepID=A0A6I9Y2Q7_9SAUR|nr:PREDICTED: anaphase-promoting complex subunit 2-like [Thamnophis sirtalis]
MAVKSPLLYKEGTSCSTGMVMGGASQVTKGSSLVEGSQHNTVRGRRSPRHTCRPQRCTWWLPEKDVVLYTSICNAASICNASWRLLEAFGLLHRHLEPYLRGLGLLEEWTQPVGRCCPGGLRERAGALLRTVLFFAPPTDFHEATHHFYGRSFRIYMWQRGSGAEEEAGGGGCGCGEECCWCPLVVEQFQQLNAILYELNLLERVSADAVTHVLHKMIEERVEWRCQGECERSFLTEFQEWIEKVIGWLSRVFLQESARASLPSSPLKLLLLPICQLEHQGALQHHPQFPGVEACSGRPEVFPGKDESAAAAPDLPEKRLGTTAAPSRSEHLDIITLYILAIKALRELDCLCFAASRMAF